MYIEKIQMKNFGKFHETSFDFAPGLNVIYGENESGKTTLHTFLTGMLFGIEKSRGRKRGDDLYSAYEPWNSASYYVGNMTMKIGGKSFLLERNFYSKEKTAQLRNLQDGEELSVEFGDLDVLLGGMTKEGYENTYCIRQAGFLADDSLSQALENYMADVTNSGDGSVRIQAATDMLTHQKKDTEKKLRKLQENRGKKISRLSMEAELLKKDIAFQKRSELSDTLVKPVETMVTEDYEVPTNKLEYLFLTGMIAGIICILAGISVMLVQKKFSLGGLLLLVLGITFILNTVKSRLVQKSRQDTTEEKVEEMIVSPLAEGLNDTLVEGLAELQEQWKEKENRYYNEEQLQELAEESEEEQELKKDIHAYELAIGTIETLSEEIYNDVSDLLREEVSKNLSNITVGKYDSIDMDDNLKLYIIENGERLPVAQLSRGTLEQAYLAMRMAVGDILMKEEQMPVLLDETFSMYDDRRLRETLRWLVKRENQILLFSCQKRELGQLDEMGISYHKIFLSESD